MKKIIFVLLIISLFTACKGKKANQIPINKPDNSVQSINKNDQKLEIDGYYIPVKRFLLGKYEMESLLVNFEEQKLLVEMNLVDTLSGESYLKKIDGSKLRSDSVFIHTDDDKWGELFIQGSFLMSPVNNPKVKEKSTVVMKGKASLNNYFFDVDFMYFGGD